MMLRLPKTVSYAFSLAPRDAENLVVVDDKPIVVGSAVLLLHQIMRRGGRDVEVVEEDRCEITYRITGKVEEWIRELISAGFKSFVSAKAIGYWCDYLVISDRDGPEVVDDYVRTGFFATVTKRPAPPFLLSAISKEAFYEGKPRILEDYVWLAEAKEKEEIQIDVVKKFLEETAYDWDLGLHVFYSREGVRRRIECYVLALSTRLHKLYGDEWRSIVSMLPFDLAMTETVNRPLRQVLRRLLDGLNHP